jgi:hypothetical protein
MKDQPMVYCDGLIAGIIGAAIIAIWFLFLDTVSGLPFYAPTVLGAALFLKPEDLASTEGVAVSLKLTLMYTWVHGLVFIVLGEIAAYFVLLPKKNPGLSLSILGLFLVLEFGFVGTAVVFAKPVFHELAWPMVLLGNFLAATGMASYLWLRHPKFVLSSVE